MDTPKMDSLQSGESAPTPSQTDAPETTQMTLEVPSGQHSEVRLDVYITGFVQNATRSKVQQAIKEGYVTVNQKREKSSYIVEAGDRIEIDLPKPPPKEAQPEAMDLDIRYEDEDLLVVLKPAGMVVHPAFGNWEGTLVNGLLHHTGGQDGLAQQARDAIRPGIVHRLDKDTSGLLVVAKHDHALSELSKQFADKSATRTYQALVWGVPEPEQGTYTGAIGRSKQDRKVMAVVGENEDPGYGKPAVTHYRVLKSYPMFSLVEYRLETGRTHQIRVHAAHHNHPVFHDPVYGGNRVRYGINTGAMKHLFQRCFEACPTQALHAKTLGFVHPSTGQWMEFDSELPQEFQDVLSFLDAHYAI
tara:strand:- start:1 stop:1077 length:1077 start_codon:yes stop_codon:yes gene_type:complete